MIAYRQMSAGELSKIAEIDRAEVVHGAFEHLEGQLVLTGVTWDIPSFFKEGEGEHTVAEQIAFCRRHLAAKGILVGAFAGEELVGIGLVTPEIRPGTAQLAYLQVSAPYRRRGIATAITQQLLDLARAQGATKVYVSATPSQPTVAFYQKFGFSPAAEPLPELYELEPEDIHMTLDLFSSPRMASLHRDLEKGRSAALDTFWSEVRQHGTPLVEHIPDDDEHVLVTFLWQGALDTSNVVVRNDDFRWTNIAGASGVRENAMTNLSGSDVWYKTYRLRSDYCVDYLLSPNDPELLGLELDDGFARKTGSSEESWRETTATWQLDPLNPQQIRVAYDEEDHPEREVSLARSTWMKSLNSYIELPGFDPNPWFKERQGVPKGRVEKHRFSSTILNNTRAVFTYTPPGDTRGEPCALLVLFDAWLYHRVIPTPVILDNLLAEGRIPPTVAVMIDQPDLQDRNEMVRNPPFLNFLTQEILPWIRHNFHITTDPTQTIVGGSSLSGLAAGLAALQHADIFGKVIMQSGAFKWNPAFGWDIPAGEVEEWLAREFASRPLLPLQFYIDVGQFESLLTINRNMRDVLQKKGYPVHYQEYYGGHNVLCWRKTLADGLLALMG